MLSVGLSSERHYVNESSNEPNKVSTFQSVCIITITKSVYQSLCFYLSSLPSLTVSSSLPLFLNLSLYLCLSLNLSYSWIIFRSVSLSFCLSFCMSFSLSLIISLSLFLSIYSLKQLVLISLIITNKWISNKNQRISGIIFYVQCSKCTYKVFCKAKI